MGLLNQRSWQQRLREFFQKPQFSTKSLDELEDLLLEADIDPTLAINFSEKLRQHAIKQKLQSEEDLLLQLAQQLEAVLLGNDGRLEKRIHSADSMQVLMLLGINGVGKTTSLAKLIHYFNEKLDIALDKITVGAGDTFRAAAIEQLRVHGQRLGVRVVAQKQGSDTAAVIYDTVSSALVRKQQLVLLDTAGRMHTKKILLQELEKINRVLDRLIAAEQRHNLLVLDATTGKNAMVQAEVFSDILPLSGVVMTKLDSKCGGGVVFSLSEKLKLPVLYAGEGERYDELVAFQAGRYVRRLLGMSEC